MANRPISPPEVLEPELTELIADRLLETTLPLEAETDLYSVGLDSMAIMQLLILVEEEYGVALPECALTRQNFRTVRDLAQLIRAQSVASKV